MTRVSKDVRKRYEQKHVYARTFKFYKNTEPDIIERLESVDNMQGYIKQLIRKDIREDGTRPVVPVEESPEDRGDLYARKGYKAGDLAVIVSFGETYIKMHLGTLDENLCFRSTKFTDPQRRLLGTVAISKKERNAMDLVRAYCSVVL